MTQLTQKLIRLRPDEIAHLQRRAERGSVCFTVALRQLIQEDIRREKRKGAKP